MEEKTPEEIYQEERAAAHKNLAECYQEYTDIKADRASFYAEHSMLLDEQQQIDEAYGDAADKVKHAVKAAHAKGFISTKFNDFTVVQKTDINVDMLRSLLTVLGMTGVRDSIIQTVTMNKLDRKAYYAARKRGDIPVDVVVEVESPGSTSVRSK